MPIQPIPQIFKKSLWNASYRQRCIRPLNHRSRNPGLHALAGRPLLSSVDNNAYISSYACSPHTKSSARITTSVNPRLASFSFPSIFANQVIPAAQASILSLVGKLGLSLLCLHQCPVYCLLVLIAPTTLAIPLYNILTLTRTSKSAPSVIF